MKTQVWKLVVPKNDNPLFYFKLLVSNELLDGIVERSNEYARRVINSNRPLCSKSVLNKWKEVTLSEMKKFFGLVFHMGFTGMPSYRAYWSERSHLYKNDIFSCYVSRKISIHNAISSFWRQASTARWSLSKSEIFNQSPKQCNAWDIHTS